MPSRSESDPETKNPPVEPGGLSFVLSRPSLRKAAPNGLRGEGSGIQTAILVTQIPPDPLRISRIVALVHQDETDDGQSGTIVHRVEIVLALVPPVVGQLVQYSQPGPVDVHDVV